MKAMGYLGSEVSVAYGCLGQFSIGRGEKDFFRRLLGENFFLYCVRAPCESATRQSPITFDLISNVQPVSLHAGAPSNSPKDRQPSCVRPSQLVGETSVAEHTASLYKHTAPQYGARRWVQSSWAL